MTLQFVDPRAVPGTPVEAYTLKADWTNGPPAIGLLANGFPDSVSFLEEVQLAIKERLPEAKIMLWDKGNASAVAGEELLETISSEVSAVIAAYGH